MGGWKMSMSDSDTEMVKPVSGHNTFYEQVLWVGKWNLHSSSFVWIIPYTELFLVVQKKMFLLADGEDCKLLNSLLNALSKILAPVMQCSNKLCNFNANV